MYQTGTKTGLRRLPARTRNEFWTFAEESAKISVEELKRSSYQIAMLSAAKDLSAADGAR
jgi:hypothetical protein